MFRKRIRQLRVSAGFSQETFAERAGLNYKHFQEIERGGKQDVRFSTMVRIADALGISPQHLFSTETPAVVLAEASGVYRIKPVARAVSAASARRARKKATSSASRSRQHKS